jgi:hypothetical protein
MKLTWNTVRFVVRIARGALEEWMFDPNQQTYPDRLPQIVAV